MTRDQRNFECPMNVGGTEAAPTIAGPGLALTAVPITTAGAPTISADAIATIATASAATDTPAQRNLRLSGLWPVSAEKSPRLRGWRAARVGGNRKLLESWCARCESSKDRSASVQAALGPSNHRARATRSLRSACSKRLCMISSPLSTRAVFRAHGTKFLRTSRAAQWRIRQSEYGIFTSRAASARCPAGASATPGGQASGRRVVL